MLLIILVLLNLVNTGKNENTMEIFVNNQPKEEKTIIGGEDGFAVNQNIIVVTDGVGGWLNNGITSSTLAKKIALDILKTVLENKSNLIEMNQIISDQLKNYQNYNRELIKEKLKNYELIKNLEKKIFSEKLKDKFLDIFFSNLNKNLPRNYIESNYEEEVNSISEEQFILFLKNSFAENYELLLFEYMSKEEFILGTTTIVVSVLDKTENKLKIWTLGDSSFVIFRKKNKEYFVFNKGYQMQKNFNEPNQLGININNEIIYNKNELVYQEIYIEKEDILLVGSDGIFDNIFEEEIFKIINLKNKFGTMLPLKQRIDIIFKQTIENINNKRIITPYSLDLSKQNNFFNNNNYNKTTFKVELMSKDDDVTLIGAKFYVENNFNMLKPRNQDTEKEIIFNYKENYVENIKKYFEMNYKKNDQIENKKRSKSNKKNKLKEKNFEKPKNMKKLQKDNSMKPKLSHNSMKPKLSHNSMKSKLSHNSMKPSLHNSMKPNMNNQNSMKPNMNNQNFMKLYLNLKNSMKPNLNHKKFDEDIKLIEKKKIYNNQIFSNNKNKLNYIENNDKYNNKDDISTDDDFDNYYQKQNSLSGDILK